MDAVEHYLYGIAIDEGYGGNRTNILALDVLYPEVCRLCELKIISHQASIVCRKLVICLGRSNKVKPYALIFICVFV